MDTTVSRSSARRKVGRPDAHTAFARRARFYHAVKDTNLAHVIKVDLKAEACSFTIDEDRQRYKSLADIERGFRVLKSDIEIGPVNHRLLQQLKRIHQQTVRTADGQALQGLTEMKPAQKSLFTALQLPVPTPAAPSQPGLQSAL